MSEFEKLFTEIKNARDGRNTGLSLGHSRLSKYIGIRKRIYTLVFGPTGSGKTAAVHDMYILNPYEDFVLRKHGKFKVILFSMERSKIYTVAKWLCRRIFLTEGILIPINKMMGWWREKISDEELFFIQKHGPYIDDLLKYVDIVEGAQNPTGIYKYLRDYAENPLNGKKERVSEFHSIYIPTDPGEIIIPIVDHIGLTKPEKGQNKKEAIDKVSEYMQYARDFWGYSPVVVSQVNRDLSNPIYQKMGSFEPTIDNAKESGRPSEDRTKKIHFKSEVLVKYR